MSQVANLVVGSAAPTFAIHCKARCRSVAIYNNGDAANQGALYYGFVDHLPYVNNEPQSTSPLTTGNGTLVPSSPNPFVISLQPNYASNYPGLNPSSPAISDDSDGADLYLISSTSATVTVKTIPT